MRFLNLLTRTALFVPLILGTADVRADNGTLTYNSSYQFQFGVGGTGNGQFDLPQAVFVDNDRDIVLVGDRFNSRVQIFDKSGNYQSQVTGLDDPLGITKSSSGIFYVSEYGSSRVRIIDSNFNKIGIFASGLTNGPIGIDVDNQDNVYVSEWLGQEFEKFNSAGVSQFKKTGFGATNMWGMAIKNDKVYISRQNTDDIRIFDTISGNFIGVVANRGAVLGTVDSPRGINFDAFGNLYVAEGVNNRVQIFNSSDVAIHTFGNTGAGNGQFNRAHSVDIADNGFLYVADDINDRIQVFEFSSTETFNTSPAGGDEDATTPLSNLVLNASGTFNGDFLQYDNLTVNGTSWTLGGTNAFDDTVDINAGTVVVNGTLTATNAFTADAGTTLMGSGTIGGSTVTVNGSVAPGNSIGTLNVTGNYVQGTGSTYTAEINAAGQSDLIAATGNVTINAGATLTIDEEDVTTYPASTDYTLITAGGTLSGTFDTVNYVNNLAFLDPTLTYNASALILNMTRNDNTFADIAKDNKDQGVATALNALGDSADPDASVVNTALTGLTNTQARRALKQVAGEEAASLSIVQGQNAQRFASMTGQRIAKISSLNAAVNGSAGGGSGGASTGGDRDTGFAAGDIPLDRLSLQGQSIEHKIAQASQGTHALGYGAGGADYVPYGGWSQGFLSRGSVDGDSNAGGYNYNSRGFAGGVDWLYNRDGIMGISLGFADSDVDYDHRGDQANVQEYRIGFYGRHTLSGVRFADLMLDTQFNANYSDIESTRRIEVGSLDRTAQSDTDSYGANGSINLSKPYTLNNDLQITPEAGLSAGYSHTDGYTETGAGALNLKIDDIKTWSLRPGIGATIAKAYNLDMNKTRTITPWIYTRADVELGDRAADMTSNFTATPNARFNSQSPDTGALWLNTGAGLTYTNDNDLALSLGYTNTLNTQNTGHTITLNAKWMW